MKKKNLIFLAMISLTLYSCEIFDNGPNEKAYYWFGAEKIALKVNYKKQFILVENVENETELKQFLGGLCDISRIDVFGEIIRDSTLESRNIHFAKIRSNCYNRLSAIEEVYYVGPYFKTRDLDLGLGYSFSVYLKNAQDSVLLDSMIAATNVRIIKEAKLDFMPLLYSIACSKESDGNALEMANYFYETGFFEFSEPSFVDGYKLN